ncbi:MAG: patatin-like phospholipase family protein [Polyangia bacterium]
MPSLADWLSDAPFTLSLSSGFFGFFAHAGMLEALVEAGLRPRRVTGSSAGAMVGGIYAAGLEPADIARRLLEVRREDFWDPSPGLGLLAGRKFEAQLHNIVGDARIEDGRIPASLVVHDVLRHRAVTREHGPLSATIRASCAVPVLFQPVWLDGRPYLDGGILDRPGITPLRDGERTFYHHLASRSPWRSALLVPARPNLTALVIEGLPRSGPFKLELGHRAYEQARATTRFALRARHEATISERSRA